MANNSQSRTGLFLAWGHRCRAALVAWQLHSTWPLWRYLFSYPAPPPHCTATHTVRAVDVHASHPRGVAEVLQDRYRVRLHQQSGLHGCEMGHGVFPPSMIVFPAVFSGRCARRTCIARSVKCHPHSTMLAGLSDPSVPAHTLSIYVTIIARPESGKNTSFALKLPCARPGSRPLLPPTPSARAWWLPSLKPSSRTSTHCPLRAWSATSRCSGVEQAHLGAKPRAPACSE